MCQFTVVSYYTPRFASFAPELIADCERFGYAVECRSLPDEFGDLIKAFDFKITFLQEMVRTFGRVLWLDVECRIVRPIPPEWKSPLISTYRSGKSSGFSSGVLMLDESRLDTIAMWLRYAQKYPRYPDDFVLDFLSRSMELEFQTVPLAFYDRDTTDPIARGNWQNRHTVIQHPTVNRWPSPAIYRRAFNGSRKKGRSEVETVSRQRKGIFFRNFGGDFDEIHDVMRRGVENEYRSHDWVFDAIDQRYAPARYWPEMKDDFTVKPRSFERSRENFFSSSGRSYRERAISRMRLDDQDAARFGEPSRWTRLREKLRGIGTRGIRTQPPKPPAEESNL